MTNEVWDLEAVYDTEVSPLMEQIIAICRRAGLPMVASFHYANNAEEGESFCTTVLPLRKPGSSPTIEGAGLFIRRGGRHATMVLTVRDADGVVKSMEEIFP